MIEYDVISSGSLGNAILIQKNILIDFGVPYKKIEPYMNDIKLVLATHIHSDHSYSRLPCHNTGKMTDPPWNHR